uniref:Uncharacterized protein n=1 Tax=Knipowitschia caucasica TaxID=637954 RepID=A0AAV2LG46_KNICA
MTPYSSSSLVLETLPPPSPVSPSSSPHCPKPGQQKAAAQHISSTPSWLMDRASGLGLSSLLGRAITEATLASAGSLSTIDALSH